MNPATVYWWGRALLIHTVGRFTRLETTPPKTASLTEKPDWNGNYFQPHQGSSKIAPQSCKTHIHVPLVALRRGLVWYPTGYSLFLYIYSLCVSQSLVVHVFDFLAERNCISGYCICYLSGREYVLLNLRVLRFSVQHDITRRVRYLDIHRLQTHSWRREKTQDKVT